MDQASQAAVMTFMRDHLDEIKFKTLRLDEVELAAEEKLAKMEQVLQTDPGLFLSKWGSNLGQDTLKQFKSIQDNYEVDYLLDSLLYQEAMDEPMEECSIFENRRPRKPKSALNTLIKNRRYAYLKQHLRHSDYFSEESMQLREPILYDQFIGQHIPMREREQPFSNTTGLVDRILSNINNKYVADHLERQKIIDEEQFEEEEEEDSGDDEDRSTPALVSKSKPKDVEMIQDESKEGDNPEEEDEAKDMAELSEFREEQRQELIQLLEEKFLAGKDETFDYVLVDYNDEYDDLEQQEQDIQDKYFDQD